MSRMRFISGGTPTSVESLEQEKERRRLEAVRVARLEMARKEWKELPAERLVSRGPLWLGWLVDSETDLIYKLRRGTTFEPGRAAFLTGAGMDLSFFVNRHGDVVVLERVESPATWSESLRRREDRGLRVVR